MMMTTTWGLNQRTLVVMWELVSTLWSLVDGCLPKELTATSALRTLIYNGSAEPHCAWVIRGAARGDVIGMKIVDWITPSGFSCSRDRLIVRDGAHASAPYLRILCGTMCGLFNDDTEVVTSTNFMRVIYTPFDLSSLQHRGFTLVYRSFTIHPVRQQAAMYTGVNYVLMCASVLVIGGLSLGLLYLSLREIGLLRLKKRQDRLDKLKRRRPAFSGQSGLRGRLGRGQSNAEVSISPPKPTATPQYPLTIPNDTHKVAERLVNTPADQNLSLVGTATPDGVISSHCRPGQNHVHDVGQLTSLSPDMTQVHCNGKTTSSCVNGEDNHVPQSQLHLTAGVVPH